MEILVVFGFILLIDPVVSQSCTKDGKTRLDGSEWKEGCTVFTCKAGHIDHELKGCYYSDTDTCREFDQVWGDPNDPCVEKGCKLVDEYSVTEYFTKKGCQKSDGTCVDVGKQFEENCSVYECVEGDNTLGREVVSQGCQFKDEDKCFKDGESVKRKCSTYRCERGHAIPDLKCSHGENCYAINSTWTEGDFEYTCKFNGTNLILSPRRTSDEPAVVVTGCKHNGIEKELGDKWTDGCFEMECIEAPNGDFVTKILSGGCEKDGQCLQDQEEWTSDCSIFKCVKKAENHYASVVVERKCQVKYENGTVMCVAEGWEGQYKKCVKQTCVVEGNRWKLKLDIACPVLDTDKTEMCVQDGWTGKHPEKRCVFQRCITNATGYVVAYDIGCPWNKNECVTLNDTRIHRCTSFMCKKTEKGYKMEKIGKAGCYVPGGYESFSETESIRDNCVNVNSLLKKYKKNKCLVYQCQQSGKNSAKLKRNKNKVC